MDAAHGVYDSAYGLGQLTAVVSEREPGRDVAAIYNSAVAAWAIAAAWELGALDELHSRRYLDAEAFAACHGLEPTATIGMFRALAAVEIVTRRGATVFPAEKFGEVYRCKSYFHWLSRGSAELFRQMPSALVSKNRSGRFYQRDSAAIAFACREIDQICYAPSFWETMNRLDPGFGVVADLGCGNGARIRDILARYPGARGVGIDIARPALEVARAESAVAGLTDRATFIEADVLHLDPDPAYAQVGLITCFMMGHDFWPRARCVQVLRRLRALFPAAQRLLLGDATRTAEVPDTELPVFTLGFELGHALMGVSIPALADWEGVFDEAGWELIRTDRIDIAVGEVLFELG